jgi:uncharacterized coiled-coil protein SlyX
MTRTDLQTRLAEFEERLATQSAERDKAQALLERMHVAVAQLQGAITVLRELVASEPEDGAAS